MSDGRSRELARAIGSGGVLDALRAAAEVRRLPAARVDPCPLLNVVSHGDSLGRAAAGYALGRVPGAAVRPGAAHALLVRLPFDKAALSDHCVNQGSGIGSAQIEVARPELTCARVEPGASTSEESLQKAPV